MQRKKMDESEALPTTRDLAQSIQKVEETLSEVLVLLYHVIQDHQEVMAAVRDQERPAMTARMLPFEPRSGPRDIRGA
jgi:hypothetical protein